MKDATFVSRATLSRRPSAVIFRRCVSTASRLNARSTNYRHVIGAALRARYPRRRPRLSATYRTKREENSRATAFEISLLRRKSARASRYELSDIRLPRRARISFREHSAVRRIAEGVGRGRVIRIIRAAVVHATRANLHFK